MVLIIYVKYSMFNIREYILKEEMQMIKILMGEKGTGKTKRLIEMANNSVLNNTGHVVFIDRGDRHIYNLSHEIRYVDTAQFEIDDFCIFYGMICGIIAQNFDVSHIFIDSIFKIVDDSMDSLKKFLTKIENLAQQFNIEFIITISGSVSSAPEYVKQYIA